MKAPNILLGPTTTVLPCPYPYYYQLLSVSRVVESPRETLGSEATPVYLCACPFLSVGLFFCRIRTEFGQTEG